MPSNAEIMAKLFNERLGNRIGRPMKAYKPIQWADSRTLTMAALESPKVQSELRREANAAKAKKEKDKTQKEVADELKKALKEQIAVKAKSEGKHKSFFEKIGGGVGNVFDVLSRGQYASTEALANVVRSTNSGEPIWSLGDDAVTGLAKGLWGTKKSDYGTVLDEARKSTGDNRFIREILPGGLHKNRVAKAVLGQGFAGTALVGGKELNQFEQEHPGIAKWEKPILNIAGSIAMDPTSYIGPGVLTKLSKAKFAENAFVKGGIAAGTFLDKPAAKAAFKLQTGTARAQQFAADMQRAQAAGHSAKKAAKIAENAAKTRNLPGEMAKQQLKDGIDKVLDNVIPAAVGRRVANFPNPESLTGTSFQNFITHMKRRGADTVDEFTANIHGGSAANQSIHGSEAGKAISSKISLDYRDFRVKSTQPKLDRIKRSILDIGPKLKKADIARLRKSDPLIDEYYTYADDLLTQHGAKMTAEQIHEEAAKKMYASLDKHVADDIESALLHEIGQQTHHTPTIRNLQSGGKIAERIGNGAAKIADLYEGSTAAKAFSYRKNFPGFTSMIAQHVRSKGVHRFEDFYKEVTDFTKAGGFTAAERKAADEAIVGKHTLTGKAEELRAFLAEKYKGIKDEEIGYGSRTPDQLVADNYTFHWIKNGGKQKEKIAVNKYISDTVERTGSIPSKEDILAKFPGAGLRFETDGVRSLLLRYKKMVRDQARMGFNDDLVTEYNIAAKHLSPEAAKNLGLVEIKANTVSKPLRESLKEGEKFYLPEQIADTRKVFSEMTGMAQGSEVGNALLRSVDTVTRHFKTLSTVYYPSYHIRNMLGDMYFGALDGVKAKDYAELLTKLKNREGSLAKIKIGDEDWHLGKLWNKYQESSKASGFMPTELPHGISQHRVNQGFQKISETREDFGRFVHYKHAYSQEYAGAKAAYPGKAKLLNSTNKKMAKDARDFLEHKADIAARARLNKYKFDYSALTPFEQKFMKRAMPFYTYMRKAAPTMVESMFLNPRMINNTNRILNQFQPEGGFDDLIAPEWMRAIGYSVLPSQSHATEPWVFRHDIMPTNLLNEYTQQGDSENMTQSVLSNLGSRLNPVALAPLQAMMGKQLFSGKKVDNIGDAALSSLRPWNMIMEAKNTNKSLKEQLVHLTGIPIQPIRKGSQKQYIEEVKAVNQRISRLGFKVYLSGGTYTLQDKDTHEVLLKGKSMEDVLSSELRQKDKKSGKETQKFVGKESRAKYEKMAGELKGTKLSDLKNQLKALEAAG